MYRVRIRLHGRPAGRLVIYEPRVTIGSSETADLRWLNAGLAPEHAELIEHQGVVAIRVLSTNACVWLNGRPIGTEAVVVPPDTPLRLGDLEIEISNTITEPPAVARHRLSGLTAIAGIAIAATLLVQILVLNRSVTWSRKWRDGLAAVPRDTAVRKSNTALTHSTSLSTSAPAHTTPTTPHP